jgi:hypothetical protein
VGGPSYAVVRLGSAPGHADVKVEHYLDYPSTGFVARMGGAVLSPLATSAEAALVGGWEALQVPAATLCDNPEQRGILARLRRSAQCLTLSSRLSPLQYVERSDTPGNATEILREAHTAISLGFGDIALMMPGIPALETALPETVGATATVEFLATLATFCGTAGATLSLINTRAQPHPNHLKSGTCSARYRPSAGSLDR